MQNQRSDKPLRAIVIMIGAIAMLVAMNTSIKLIGTDYHVFQIAFVRNLIATFVLLPLILKTGGVATLRTSRPWSQLARSVSGVASVCCFYYAVQRLPVADVMVISQAVPFFVTALAVPFLGETVGWRRWTAVALGFTGVIVAMGPIDQLSAAAMLVVVGTALWSVTFLLVRSLGATDSPEATTFYYMVFGTIVMGLAQPWVWKAPIEEVWWLLLAAGVLGACGQVMVAYAMKFGEASPVTPFNYSAILWGVFFDFVIWSVAPTWTTMAGAAIIIMSGLYISWRESLKARVRRC